LVLLQVIRHGNAGGRVSKEIQMPLNYLDLDARIRAFMCQEIDVDIANGTIYLSPWLSERGRLDWPQLLRDAAASGTDATLTAEISLKERLSPTVQREPAADDTAGERIPSTASETIAEGEFNRFYVRGLCLRAIDDEVPDLIVYRANSTLAPRPGSEEKIGAAVDPTALLVQLRATMGVEPALGLPPDPRSELTLKLP
jgi:hypothetical protein